MRFLKKMTLTVLSVMPIASISTVAYCQLNEMAGEEQNDLLHGQISTAHQLLMAPGTVSTTEEESKAYLSRQTGITDPKELDTEFQRHLRVLIEKGLVEKNETNITSSIPSRW
jgi:hypothetical protein